METRYDPKTVEQRWYDTWEQRGYFKARESLTGKTFTISMPPPNITGDLHMGHAMYTLQDVLVRWHRMLGNAALWVPGTDHAAIATQNVLEKQLAKKGTSKEAIGRQAWDKLVQEWYDTTGHTILQQMRRLGFSADWSRIRFTMDPAYVEAIRYVFVQLWKQGLIYRGPRIVNWCPRDQSAISDLEVQYEEEDGHLYYLAYPVEGGGTIPVATARPETMVGDTGVAVHPDDWRYKDLIGKSVMLPIVHRRVPIVADEAVDQEFGTGAVKVTPGHDATDYDIGERHHLPVLSVLSLDGRMNIPEIPQLHGLKVAKARDRIVEMLRAEGALQKVEPYRHSVGHCDRCGAVIEPIVSAQWWVRMKLLAGPAIAVAEADALRFHPERWREQYLRWMRNIRDWNISRQLWLGHRIPVWTCANGHAVAYLKDPPQCEQCGDRHLTQDPDVLDTWFSSSLWPFVTLGWPADTEDLRRFYPTQVLDTARDILYLWVARMVFMSLHFLHVLPFSDVLIHGTVLAPDGRRMSKSLGTGVDPLDMIERYGADATRAWTAYFGTGGQDIRFSEEKIKSYQLFANKLWNATRLLVSKLPDGAPLMPIDEATLEPADTWILGRLSAVTRMVTESFQRFEFGPAIDALYEFTWHEFADDYLELIKPRLQADDTSTATALAVAVSVLETTLRLLHPIMPFVTEELWQRLPHEGETIMYAAWPLPDETIEDRGLIEEMAHLLEVVRAVRNVRQASEQKTRRQPAEVTSARRLLTERVGRAYLATLARLELNGKLPEGTPQSVVVVGDTTVRLGLPGDGGAERERLRTELQKKLREIESIEAKLNNPDFTQNAPRAVVERERARLAQAREAADRLRGRLGETGGLG
ncbi:MAG TPA: valine--tRNA ligase [Candidatus Dormibacteraeota bacterium]|nr:valine--tRNA ligase [Candidatus Dormibacteraeota bacterium]